MEEVQQECDHMTGNHIHHLKVQKEEFENQYQLMNRDRILLIEELAQQKGDERQINRKLMWFLYLDEIIERKLSEIDNLQRYNRVVNFRLPNNSVPTTTGSLRADRKHCQKKLIKKGRIDIEYLHQVHEEHLSLKKSGGTQELNDMIESMVQRIQHGNKKRADEMKMHKEISNFTETKETIIAQEPELQRHQWRTRERRSKRDIDWKRSLQHKINIRLDDIENIKRQQTGRKARVRRLKGELEHVRKNISYLDKKLANINLKRLEAYKCAYGLGEEETEFDGY